MTELRVRSATGPRFAASSRLFPQPRSGHPAHLAATLTDLSSMISRVHTIRGRGGAAHDLDQRLTGVIAELESLIHDLLHDAGPAGDDRGKRPLAAGTRPAPA